MKNSNKLSQIGISKIVINLISDSKAGNPESYINIYKANTYLPYVMSSLFVLNIAFPIVNNIYRPKYNVELKQALVQKYTKEIDDLGILK